MSIEGLGEAYNPTVSDPIKGRAKTSFNAASDEWRAWIKTWFKMALEYPESYLAAIIASTYGYYSFTPKLPFGSGNMNSGTGQVQKCLEKNFRNFITKIRI